MKKYIFTFFTLICAACCFGESLVVDNATAAKLHNGDQVSAIVIDNDGTMSEQNLIYDAALQALTTTKTYSGENVSYFAPSLNLHYLWWDGHWVDSEGFYWENGKWTTIGVHNWNDYWDHYWGHYWDPRWSHYWQNHHDDHGWRYRDHRDWSHHDHHDHSDTHHHDEHHEEHHHEEHHDGHHDDHHGGGKK